MITNSIVYFEQFISTHQGTHDEECDEEPPERRLTKDVAIANRWHGDQRHVHALPVGQLLGVGEVVEWVARRLHLRGKM